MSLSDQLAREAQWVRDYTADAYPADRLALEAHAMRLDLIGDIVARLEERLRPRGPRERRRLRRSLRMMLLHLIHPARRVDASFLKRPRAFARHEISGTR
jgi:uncharacterized protein with HEPN domain